MLDGNKGAIGAIDSNFEIVSIHRGRGPGVLQPYRDLWKLFHKDVVVPETASWLFWATPVVDFTCMMTVPILIPVLTNFPLPLSNMGDILAGGHAA